MRVRQLLPVERKMLRAVVSASKRFGVNSRTLLHLARSAAFRNKNMLDTANGNICSVLDDASRRTEFGLAEYVADRKNRAHLTRALRSIAVIHRPVLGGPSFAW